MADAPKAIRITRGYAVDQKGADALKAAGVRTIYRADKGEVPMSASMLTPEQAAAMQRLSAQKRTAGRMGPAAAERAWHNHQIATPELFRELTGWAPSTAHARWGGRWATLRRPRKPR